MRIKSEKSEKVTFKKLVELAKEENLKEDAEIIFQTDTCCGYDDSFVLEEDNLLFDDDRITANFYLGSCRESGGKKACKNLKVKLDYEKLMNSMVKFIEEQNLLSLCITSSDEDLRRAIEATSEIRKKPKDEIEKLFS